MYEITCVITCIAYRFHVYTKYAAYVIPEFAIRISTEAVFEAATRNSKSGIVTITIMPARALWNYSEAIPWQGVPIRRLFVQPRFFQRQQHPAASKKSPRETIFIGSNRFGSQDQLLRPTHISQLGVWGLGAPRPRLSSGLCALGFHGGKKHEK